MVAAVGRGVRWPAATGVLVTGAPVSIAPAGSSEERDHVPVCGETSQITMGLLGRKPLTEPCALWGTVGGNQARLADVRLRRQLGAGDAEAGSFEIRPSLL